MENKFTSTKTRNEFDILCLLSNLSRSSVHTSMQREPGIYARISIGLLELVPTLLQVPCCHPFDCLITLCTGASARILAVLSPNTSPFHHCQPSSSQEPIFPRPIAKPSQEKLSLPPNCPIHPSHEDSYTADLTFKLAPAHIADSLRE